MSAIHANDIGTVITVTLTNNGAVLDLTTATEIQLILMGPGNKRLTYDAHVVTAATGVVSYTTQDNDLVPAGAWRLQALVTFPSGTWASTIAAFTVESNLFPVSRG